MLSMADMLSVPTEIKCGDKVYHLRPPNQLEEGKFQRWLEQRADEAIERKTWLSDAARAEEKRLLNRDIAAGHYDWYGRVSVEAWQSRAGTLKILEIILDIPEAEAVAIIESHLETATRIIQGALERDPKAVGAVLTSLGLPADFLNKKGSSSSASATRRSASRKRKSKR